MIAPVNVAPPQQPLVSTETAIGNKLAQVASQSFKLAATTSPDLSAAPSLKKAAPSSAKTSVKTIAKTIDRVGAGGDLWPQKSRYVAQTVTGPVAAPVANSPTGDLPQDLSSSEPLAAEATPLDQVPTLPAEPPIVPQTGAPAPEVEAPADGLGQNEGPLQPPSQVLPQQPGQPLTPPQTGTPPAEPSNYLQNQPGNVAPYYNQNYIGPAISFGNDTVVGAASRFGIGKNISVRPSLFLGNTTRLAVPVTYDFGFNQYEQFETNPLVVFHAGGGLDYTSSGGNNGSRLNPLVVAGADIYFGDGASVLLQVGNAFNSNFIGVIGVGLQF